MEDNLIFKSNKDGFMKFLLWAWLYILPFVYVIILYINRNEEDIISMFFFFVFTLLFMFFFSYSMWFGFQYIIKDNKVITIKAGIIPLGEINIYQIKKICKKRSSSYIYATSMDKIISIQTYDKKEWNISPINKELFIASVVGLNPKIEVNI